jgi:hypothetical protein
MQENSRRNKENWQMKITRIFSLFVTLTILAWSPFAMGSCVTTVATGSCPASGAYPQSSSFTESNGYNTYVDNGVTGGYGVTPETQTLTANSGSSWSVLSDFGASTHQLAFPITEQAYNAETVDNFTNIVATANDTIPSNSGTGVEAGLLIYLDSWGKQIEIQHYVENESTCNGTTPVKTSIQFGGSYGVPTNSWDLCYTGSMYYWQIVGSGSSWGFTSGSMELVSMIKYLETNGYLPTSSTLNDMRYGFMIYTTTSTQETFTLNNLSIIHNVSSGSPTIALSPTSLNFSATVGGGNPSAQNVTVSNSGGGTLASPTTSINYSQGSGWLSVNCTGSSAPYTCATQPATGSLAAGTYNATVSVASSGATNTPQTYTVAFTVNAAPPAISLSPTSLSFSATQGGGNPSAQNVTVSNSGGGTLAVPTTSITYHSGSGWLTVTEQGSSAPYTLVTQPATGSLAAGTYTATVNVSSAGASNSPQSYTVSFTVNAASPAIALSPTSLNFSATVGGGNPSAQNVTVSNSGGGTLASPTTSINYSQGSGWLSVNCTGSSAPYTCSTQPTTGSLAAGTYNATVQVSSAGASNSPQSYTVAFTVNSGSAAIAFVQVNAATVSSANTETLAFASNTTAGDMILVGFDMASGSPTSVTDTQGNTFVQVGSTLTNPNGHLAALYYAANIKGGADSVTVNISATANFLQEYLTEYSGVATSSPIDVQAGAVGSSSTVSSGNATTTVANDLIFGYMDNGGSGSAGSGFMLRSNFSGNVVEDEAAGAPGSYAATGTANASWTMQMAALKPASTGGGSPTISLSPTSLSFSATQGGGNPSAKNVTVSNSGGGTLASPTTSINYSQGSGWLSVNCTGSQAPYTCSTQPTTGSLSSGTYNATVSVASTGATNTPQTYTVAFTVNPVSSPTISLSPTSLTFTATAGGGNPSSQNVTVSNSGGGTLAVPTTSTTYHSGSGWLSVQVQGSSAPYTLVNQPTTGSLSAGTYTATVSVASTGATNTPQTYSVTFTVNSGSVCTITAALGVCPSSGLYYDTGLSPTTWGQITQNDVWSPPSTWSQTMYTTNPGNWYIVANFPTDSSGAIHSYPSAAIQYYESGQTSDPNPTLDSFSEIVGTFSETAPSASTGVVSDIGYDMWFNNWASEIMIQHQNINTDVCTDWTTVIATNVQFGGSNGVPTQTWNLCQNGTFGSSNPELIWQYYTTAGSKTFGESSSSVDIYAMLKYLEGHAICKTSSGTTACLPSGSTLTQFGYGFEISTTDGVNQTFTVNSLTQTAQ